MELEITKSDTLRETNLGWPLYRGKVRDTYTLNEDTLLLVSTDRISAFDVVMRQPIPQKGVLLNNISAYWFKKLSGIFPNHMLAIASDSEMVEDLGFSSLLEKLDTSVRLRSMVVKRAKRIDMECIVRGYLAGSAAAEYKKSGTLNGYKLPYGLVTGSKLKEPIFTPSTKATTFGHDEPLSRAEGEALIGKNLYKRLEAVSLTLFNTASELVEKCGLILVDTKFEFGFVDGELTIIDELLTPDSSRFWDVDEWHSGSYAPFDKQLLRNWLMKSGWDKNSPPPDLPEDLVQKTAEKYVAVYKRLMGKLA